MKKWEEPKIINLGVEKTETTEYKPDPDKFCPHPDCGGNDVSGSGHGHGYDKCLELGCHGPIGENPNPPRS